jgi:GTP-binding protein Era
MPAAERDVAARDGLMGGQPYRSGFVTLAGRPNVGKSTLVNLLVGEKVAIVSNRPQTTRNTVRGILTRADFQAVFLDTPGLHKPTTKLGVHMQKSAEGALGGVDIILYMVEPTATPDADAAMFPMLKRAGGSKIFLVINKTDTVKKPEILRVIAAYSKAFAFDEIVPLSALKADNTDALITLIGENLPEGPKYFPDDMFTDQPERTLAAEIIREKALRFLMDEVPHGVAAEVVFMGVRANRNRAGMDAAGSGSGGLESTRANGALDVEANVYCEREAHKGIIIGKDGSMLKKIGSSARHELARLLGSPVNLRLWVKTRKAWRDNEAWLRDFGYGCDEHV